MSTNILVVDDEQDLIDLLKSHLHKRGYEVDFALTGEAAVELLRDRDYDAVVTDVKMDGMGGLALCQWIAENRADTPVIVETGFGSMETAISAMRAGAHDFITKPVDLQVLEFTIRRAVGHRELRQEVRRLRHAFERPPALEGMIGESATVRKMTDLIHRVADSDATTLITGESGTGKELVARSLHDRSARAAQPFVAVNCAALPGNLLESELFGYERGAFTDARRSHEGLLRQANGGTLFLDEVAEMPLDMQVKLLRALQERRARPLGGNSELPFDVRIVGATNRDIETCVEEGAFREDLYYRLNVIRIQVPPLRSRGHDVLLLAQHFLERIARRTEKSVKGIAPAAARALLDYDWPGNVRELENTIERAVALARLEEVMVDDLPEKVRSYQSDRMVLGDDNPDDLLPMAEVEKRYIFRVLKAVSGNKTQAANVLGLDRRTLYRKLERYERAVSADS
jgi:two-component system response regulator HydG